MEATTVTRPWSALANEERDGMYADFEAWRQWVANKFDTVFGDDCPPLLDVIGDADHKMEIALYCVMCDLADKSHHP